jgi:5-methylcytosine-specific restriction endonuclease McrA
MSNVRRCNIQRACQRFIVKVFFLHCSELSSDRHLAHLRPVAGWRFVSSGRSVPHQGRTGSRLQPYGVLVQTTLVKRRKAAFLAQQGLCFYCRCQMLPATQASRSDQFRICTAEHLQARQDGGTDRQANLVAACWYCNHSRHTKFGGCSPSRYKRLVKQEVRKGGWPTVPLLTPSAA